MKTSKKKPAIRRSKKLRTTRGNKSFSPVAKVTFKEDLLERLQDLDYASGYLTAALEEGEDIFLLAVRDVAQAQGGIGSIAKRTKLSRENLYSMLSSKGNPRLSSITTVLDRLGFEFRLFPKLQGTHAA